MADGTTFAAMAGEFPVRTGVFTLVPLLFTLLLLANYAHGASPLWIGGFALAVVAYTVLVNQYHLAAFRRAKASSHQGS
jgi:hypothetical protein